MIYAAMCLSICLGFASFSARSELLVHAASSLNAPLEAILAEFSLQTGIQAKATYGSSGTLARHILAGAPGDVFISAHPVWIHRLKTSGATGEGVIFAYNQLLLVVSQQRVAKNANLGPINKISDLEPKQALAALINADAGRIVTADPTHAPLGSYAIQALRCFGLEAEFLPSLAYTSNAQAAIALLTRAEANAGLIYASDAQIHFPQSHTSSDHIQNSAPLWDHIKIPVSASGPITYIAAPLTGSRSEASQQDLKKFFDYLQSVNADKLLHSYGFLTKKPIGQSDEAVQCVAPPKDFFGLIEKRSSP